MHGRSAVRLSLVSRDHARLSRSARDRAVAHKSLLAIAEEVHLHLRRVGGKASDCANEDE